MKALSRHHSHLATGLGIGVAALFWGVDILVECFISRPDCTCMDLLSHPDPTRLWLRLLASGLILLLVVQSTLLLRRREEAEAKLAHSQFLLEELAIELNHKNEKLQHEIKRREAMEKQLEALAVTDGLTGVFNRRKFDEILNLEMHQEARYPRGLVLLMLDIDHFKEVNDHFGHAVGDGVLKDLARLVESTKREADSFFRVGGEEFCLITFSANGSSLETMADKLRQAIAQHPFPKAGRLTISIGVARFKPEDTYDSLFKRADNALYQAKQTGRNKVVLA